MLPIKVRQVLPGNRAAVAVAHRFVEATEDDFRHARDDVVAESLAVTLSYWRRRVVPERRWDPSDGAQLRTFFVNIALKRLVKVAARTLREIDQLPATDRAIGRELAAASTDPTDAPSPYARIDDADAARRELVGLDLTALEWRIFRLTVEGCTHDQIARVVGLSSGKAVESRIARCRRRLAAA